MPDNIIANVDWTAFTVGSRSCCPMVTSTRHGCDTRMIREILESSVNVVAKM